MGFYVRKRVKAGPFRFNMSKSGVGVSVGVPGFRIGNGPRGNYVHMGRGGTYYRSSLGGTVTPSATPFISLPESSGIVMEDVTGATIMDMEPSAGDDVVVQLNAAARHFRWAWVVTIVAVVVGAATMPWGIVVWVLAAPLCWWMFLRDAAKKKVVLFYDVNDGAAEWFDALVGDWVQLSDAQKLWRTVESGDVRTLNQHKRNAGASALVKRIDAAASLAGPKNLASNVAIPTVSAGKARLYLLPDRVLVQEGTSYSDVSYQLLNVRGFNGRFIESPGSTPRDSQKVGETWQYVNKKGGPDRRFANNPVLPIMLYSNLAMTSRNGLNWQIQCSRTDATLALARVLDNVPPGELVV